MRWKRNIPDDCKRVWKEALEDGVGLAGYVMVVRRDTLAGGEESEVVLSGGE